jgi:serine/threonine-protein kinase
MKEFEAYKMDYRLVDAYNQATRLDEEGLEALCPAYSELAEEGIRYRDSTLLGMGALKEVYKTFDNHTRRWIAMARLRSDRGPEFYDLFVHEAWLTASLNHPNIITIHDAGVDADGRPFFTMDLKGDSTLADRVSGPRSAGRRELLEIFMKVCDAVAYAHSRGVVHFDLKPENIQTDTFGEVLVCDWGLAKVVGEMEDGEDELPMALWPVNNMTLMGQIKGSPGFMAPEQTIPRSAKDHRSDIFALGCILHYVLTGQPPFTGSEEEILATTCAAEYIPPRTRYPDRQIPAALEAVVLKATQKRLEARYQSAQALRDEISNFIGGYSTLAENPGFIREARLFLRRHRLPASIVFVAIVALSVISVLFVQGIQEQRERARRFESKAETVTSLYRDELERSESERRALSAKLATSASDLKKLGIYIRPVETVKEARKLVASALALDGDSANAVLQRFSLDCITLNFKNALDHPVNSGSTLADYLLFVKAFPGFDFTDEKRPTIDQLTRFLDHARQLNPRRQALMERIVAYDFALRSDKGASAPVIEALLDYKNGLKGVADLLYDSEKSALTMQSDQDVHLSVRDEYGSNECLLRFLPFRSLTLEVSGFIDLCDLQSLQIESLDLRSCETVIISKDVDLPFLRKVYICPGQINEQTLRRAIHANERFNIVEASEGL